MILDPESGKNDQKYARRNPSVVVRAIGKAGRSLPAGGTDFDAMKADIAAMMPGDEIIRFGKHVILWGKRDEKTYGATAYHRLLIKRPYYRRLTIRNGNTFDALSKRL